MAITVLIPTALRSFTDRRGEAAVSGDTVGAAVAALAADYPGIKPHLYDDGGALRSYMNIYVGKENVKSLNGMDTALNDGDTIMLVPAIAGGFI